MTIIRDPQNNINGNGLSNGHGLSNGNGLSRAHSAKAEVAARARAENNNAAFDPSEFFSERIRKWQPAASPFTSPTHIPIASLADVELTDTMSQSPASCPSKPCPA